ncbi:major facilitator superfamily domain-containing protein [Myxozyma melibiosi]|uniref:Major facilitator superfamily domain-containing protein n=1 Tax=Myxozyma melibiosi TaxID=54550 RepID=A0ABR1F8K4_9ASCO
MAFGILEDNELAHVPGTAQIEDKLSDGLDIPDAAAANLKHAKGKNSHIILVPQPSDDPNDPLNWSILRRDILFLIHSFGYVINVGVCGPILAAGTLVEADDLGVTITDIALLSGYQLLVIACCGPIVSALSRIFGKRPQFVAASIFGLIGTIVCCTANTYNTLLAGRIIQGFGNVAYESIVISVIGDLYCLHERGLRLAVFNFCFGGINCFTSVISGPIVTNLGWRWLFYIDVIFVALQCFLMCFCSTETTYIRDAKYELDVAGDEIFDDMEKIAAEHLEGDSKPAAETAPTTTADAEKAVQNGLESPIPAKKTYLQSIMPYHGRVSNENPIRLIVRPFAVFLNPGMTWIILAMSIPIAWIVNINYCMSQLYGAPPYNMTAERLGFMSAGPLIGGFLASLFFFVVNNPMTLWVSRKNGGVYEPEFKLPVGVILGTICLTIGCFGFGTAYRNRESAIVAAVMYGFLCAGSTTMAITASNYMIDAYREFSVEVIIATMSLKNFIFYGFSYFFNNWVANSGPDIVFDVLGAIAIFTSLILSIPLYIYGKRIRSWWHRAKLLEKLKLA